MGVLILEQSSPASLVNINFSCDKVLSYQFSTTIKLDFGRCRFLQEAMARKFYLQISFTTMNVWKKYLLQLGLIEWIFCFHYFSVARNTFISIVFEKINACNILSHPVFTKWCSKAIIKKALLSCSTAKKLLFQIVKIFVPFVFRSAKTSIL